MKNNNKTYFILSIILLLLGALILRTFLTDRNPDVLDVDAQETSFSEVEEQQERALQEFNCRCEDCGEGMDEDDLVCPSCGELAGFDRELNPETRNDFIY